MTDNTEGANVAPGTPEGEETEGDMIYIKSRLGAELFEAAPEKYGVLMAVADRAATRLINEEGGDPATLTIAVNRELVTVSETGGKLAEPYPVVAVLVTCVRPSDWVRPEPVEPSPGFASIEEEAAALGVSVESLRALDAAMKAEAAGECDEPGHAGCVPLDGGFIHHPAEPTA